MNILFAGFAVDTCRVSWTAIFSQWIMAPFQCVMESQRVALFAARTNHSECWENHARKKTTDILLLLVVITIQFFIHSVYSKNILDLNLDRNGLASDLTHQSLEKGSHNFGSAQRAFNWAHAMGEQLASAILETMGLHLGTNSPLYQYSKPYYPIWISYQSHIYPYIYPIFFHLFVFSMTFPIFFLIARNAHRFLAPFWGPHGGASEMFTTCSGRWSSGLPEICAPSCGLKSSWGGIPVPWWFQHDDFFLVK